MARTMFHSTANPGPLAAPQEGFVHPQTLMAIRNLELRAKVVVEGFWNGLHRSPYHGFSVEFTEYRPYSPGDDPRYLDWKLFARTDRYYIKKYEDETNLRCYLLVDNSRSMDYGTLAYTKAQYANTLAATLACFLHYQGDAVGLLTFDEHIREYLPARNRPGHLRHLMLALDQPAGGRTTNLERPLQRIVDIVRKRGLVVMISDLLAPAGDMERQLASLTASGHEVILFQLLDPGEVGFDFELSGMYRDAETDQDLYIDPRLAAPKYREMLAAHVEAVELICRKLDIAFQQFTSDRPLELALFDFLRARMQASKRVRRAGMARRHE